VIQKPLTPKSQCQGAIISYFPGCPEDYEAVGEHKHQIGGLSTGHCGIWGENGRETMGMSIWTLTILRRQRNRKMIPNFCSGWNTSGLCNVAASPTWLKTPGPWGKYWICHKFISAQWFWKILGKHLLLEFGNIFILYTHFNHCIIGNHHMLCFSIASFARGKFSLFHPPDSVIPSSQIIKARGRFYSVVF